MMQFSSAVGAIISLSLCASVSAAVRYVDVGLTTGLNNGATWADAYQGSAGLYTALTASVSGDQVWVANGTYKPTTTTSRTVSFTLKTGVAVYGGFAGGETQLASRNPAVNVCILTGDLLGNDTTSSTTWTDNSYHVVVGTGALSTAVLDGFTVKGGYANGATASNYDKGGGIIIVNSGSPTVRNCTFVGNRCTFGGGAGYIYAAGGTFEDCVFQDNVGGSYGGAFDTNAVTSNFRRCSFINNQAARAGAIESYGGSTTTITNCLFRSNRATTANSGGAVWAGSSSSCTIRNSTFVANSCTGAAGGGIYNTAAAVNVSNCVLWGNTGTGTVTGNQITSVSGTMTVSYSIVQGGFTGTANLASDPAFVDLANFDLHLSNTSPAIDSGANASVPAGTTTDRDLAPRFVDIGSVPDTGSGTAPIVDRGCYERQVPPPPPCPADLSGDGVVDGQDLALLLSQWGAAGNGDLNQDGAIDGGDMTMLLAAWGFCP